MTDITLTRVPQIIVLYWVIKIASTTLGETGADMFSMTFGFGYGSTILIFLATFVVLCAVKISLGKYEPFTYWLTFTATAIVGTAISDYIDRTLGLGYAIGSLILIAILAVILVGWYAKARTLSVERITSPTTEIYYWLAFLVANTLGTAAGDFLADDMGLGFLYGALLISGILFAMVILHFYTNTSIVLLFWIAFVLTRPFGAMFGDLLTKPSASGGLDMGTIGASLVFSLILAVALYLEIKRHRVVSVA